MEINTKMANTFQPKSEWSGDKPNVIKPRREREEEALERKMIAESRSGEFLERTGVEESSGEKTKVNVPVRKEGIIAEATEPIVEDYKNKLLDEIIKKKFPFLSAEAFGESEKKESGPSEAEKINATESLVGPEKIEYTDLAEAQEILDELGIKTPEISLEKQGKLDVRIRGRKRLRKAAAILLGVGCLGVAGGAKADYMRYWDVRAKEVCTRDNYDSRACDYALAMGESSEEGMKVTENEATNIATQDIDRKARKAREAEQKNTYQESVEQSAADAEARELAAYIERSSDVVWNPYNPEDDRNYDTKFRNQYHFVEELIVDNPEKTAFGKNREVKIVFYHNDEIRDEGGSKVGRRDTLRYMVMVIKVEGEEGVTEIIRANKKENEDLPNKDHTNARPKEDIILRSAGNVYDSDGRVRITLESFGGDRELFERAKEKLKGEFDRILDNTEKQPARGLLESMSGQ